MNPNKKAVIVIPVYKNELNENERFSLERCKKILYQYPIVFVAPETSNFNYTQNYEIIKFPDHYFHDIVGYNSLMLSSEFYQKFQMYDYMLLYQLDAFVFSDQLLYWCNQDLDYIGAAWVGQKRGFRSGIKYAKQVKEYINSLKNQQNYDKNLRLDFLAFKNVGNGGFSLRKIATFLSLTQKYKDWTIKIIENNIPEDTFWGVLVNLYQPKTLKIASYKQGIKFAFEMNPSRTYKLNWWRLPFGCHDFEDWEPEFWQNIFKKLKD